MVNVVIMEGVQQLVDVDPDVSIQAQVALTGYWIALNASLSRIKF